MTLLRKHRFGRAVRLWIGLAISLGTLIWAFHGVDLLAVWRVSQGMRLLWLLPMGLLVVINHWCRAARWRLMFNQASQPATIHFFSAVNIGYLANNILPLRAGEFVRAYFIAKILCMSKMQALSTIVVERVVDMLTVIVALLGVIPFLPSLPDFVGKTALTMGIITLVATIVLVFLSNQRMRFLALLDRGLFFVSQGALRTTLLRMADSMLEGLSALRTPGAAAKILVWTTLIWLVTNAYPYALFWALDMSLPFSAAVFVICVTSLGVAVPSSPGFVGVVHSLIVLCLVTVYSVDKSVALSFALIAHAWQYLLQVFLGGAVLAQRGVSFGELTVGDIGEGRKLKASPPKSQG